MLIFRLYKAKNSEQVAHYFFYLPAYILDFF